MPEIIFSNMPRRTIVIFITDFWKVYCLFVKYVAMISLISTCSSNWLVLLFDFPEPLYQ